MGADWGEKHFAVLTKPFVSDVQLEKYFYEKQLLITLEKLDALNRIGRGGAWRHFQDHEFDLANCSRCISLSGSFVRGRTEGKMSKLIL